MEIKDCLNLLHLYLGCQIRVKIEGIWTNWTVLTGHYLDLIRSESCETEAIELQLRQLSSMTDEEAIEFADILGNSSHLSIESKIAQVMEVLPNILYKQTNIHGINWIRATIWLLSKSFDLFGLIENGSAIDLETIKQ